MSVARSRQLGQALMGGSALALLLFLIGVNRRSYAALALPVFAGLAIVSGLTFWVGYTMANTQWEEPPAPEPAPEARGDALDGPPSHAEAPPAAPA